MAWGYYNYLLFRIRGDRRGSRVAICFDEDFANRYHLDLQTLRAAKEEPRLCRNPGRRHIAVEPASGSPVLSASPTLTGAPGRREH
jgi:hypothetical protein